MLVNISKEYQLDSLQKEQLSQEISATYGGLAFLYAKHVWQGNRTVDSLHNNYKIVVPEIISFVKENGYHQIMT